MIEKDLTKLIQMTINLIERLLTTRGATRVPLDLEMMITCKIKIEATIFVGVYDP